jgi:hypothetical protein
MAKTLPSYVIFTVLSSEHGRTLLAPPFGGTLYISEYLLRTSELQETLGLGERFRRAPIMREYPKIRSR